MNFFANALIVIVLAIGVIISAIIFNSKKLPRNVRFKEAFSDLGLIILMLILALANSVPVEIVSGVLMVLLGAYVLVSTGKYRKEHTK